MENSAWDYVPGRSECSFSGRFYVREITIIGAPAEMITTVEKEGRLLREKLRRSAEMEISRNERGERGRSGVIERGGRNECVRHGMADAVPSGSLFGGEEREREGERGQVPFCFVPSPITWREFVPLPFWIRSKKWEKEEEYFHFSSWNFFPSKKLLDRLWEKNLCTTKRITSKIFKLTNYN